MIDAMKECGEKSHNRCSIQQGMTLPGSCVTLELLEQMQKPRRIDFVEAVLAGAGTRSWLRSHATLLQLENAPRAEVT